MTLLTVMTAVLPSRTQMYAELREELERQFAGRDVELLSEGGDVPTGDKYQAMLDRAVGEYVCNIDDDDLPLPGYADRLLQACLQGPDIVTFEMLQTIDGKNPRTWSLSLDNRDDWLSMPDKYGDPCLGFQTNQLCPVRTELARMSSWPALIRGVDQVYTKTLRMLNVLHTEVHIPERLYHYRYSSSVTAAQTPEMEKAGRELWGGRTRVMWRVAEEHAGLREGAILSTQGWDPGGFLDRSWRLVDADPRLLEMLGELELR